MYGFENAFDNDLALRESICYFVDTENLISYMADKRRRRFLNIPKLATAITEC